MPTISLFNNAKTPFDPHKIDHAEVIEGIRSGKWKKEIDKLNSFEYDSDAQKEFKRTKLPGVTWQGDFSYRDEIDLIQHSGMVAIDIDHLPPDELNRYRELITKNQYTHALFLSPRRDGLKVIIKIPANAELHKEYLAAIGEQYKKHAPKYYDHFDDICRLCFVSYDPDIYYNPDSKVFEHRVAVRKFTKSDADISKVASDIKSTFNRIRSWADKTSSYSDGNKHTHLVKLFTACNRSGVPKDDAVKMAYNRYGETPNTEPVPFANYEHIADSVYRLYSADFGTRTFNDTEEQPVVSSPTTEPPPPPPSPQPPPPGATTTVSFISDPTTDPVSYYNNTPTCLHHAKHILEDAKWRCVPDTSPEVWQCPQASEDEVSATFDTILRVVLGDDKLETGHFYTPFQILVILKYKGNFRAATEWIIAKYMEEEIPYIRVGIDYFKRIDKQDRFGIKRKELKKWTKEEIKQDHGKNYIDTIPHFDDFAIEPNNQNYSPVVNNCYNLYREFPHRPKEGQWKWTEILLRHIFGEQYHLGIRYLQALYLNPERLMPILVLVSRERQTGKTTFINWLGMVFGDNMANIAPEDLVNGFNSTYAASNIISIEETIIEKSLTVEKIKALATTKFITVNQKFVSQYRMPFYGKIILTSNNEDKFARIDQEEIRFFIRKVPVPTTHNHNIERDMIEEIPAFLHYLTTLPPVDWSLDRTGFTPSELDNDSLKSVKKESLSEVCKEISMHIEYLFLNELKDHDTFMASAKNIKERFYSKDHRNGYDWIRRVLSVDLKLDQVTKPVYYRPFNSEDGRTERPFIFNRETFVKDEPDPITLPPPQELIPF